MPDTTEVPVADEEEVDTTEVPVADEDEEVVDTTEVLAADEEVDVLVELDGPEGFFNTVTESRTVPSSPITKDSESAVALITLSLLKP